MSNKNKTTEHNTIHDFDFNLICEYFALVERQGPGSPETTVKALSFVDNLTEQSRIADIGCGTGGQTMVLAQNVPGKITALDLFPDFINIFNRNAEQLGLHERVKGVVGSMIDPLPFEKESIDLIWSEGAIYNIGFERGFNEWKQYLKTGGYIAASEATWFTDERPDEITDFWMENYPEIDTIPNKVAQIQKAGYIPVATFIIPENCWTEYFFAPCSKVQEGFLKKYAGNKMAEDLIVNQRREQGLYNKYKEFYGYVFYIAKKL
ncbi:MAG: class I SAM-dependent methyltransferase [Bacteroidales bacterium]|jgi:SAM-dependent methyltransferase|nr:class I SAM-dependent methyltransferase [Bacteroidales bacterium]